MSSASTLADTVEPEWEPVHFTIDNEKRPPELEQLVVRIKQTAEKYLYHWKTFPVVLPPSVTVQHEGDGSSLARRKPINMRDLFVAPSFDELDAVALDAKGEPRRLNNKQLECVREKGEFEVESINFPGQVHHWHLSQLLQKGTARAHESFLNDTSLALRFIIITARARLVSHFFSLSQSLQALVQFILKLLGILIGVPSLRARNLDEKVHEERCRYMVAELLCQPQLEDDLESLCHFVRQQIKKSSMEKYHLEDEKSPPVPYLFHTPKGTELDLRLFNRELMRKALPTLVSILEKEARGWFLQFREKTIAELKLKQLTDEEVERVANKAVMDEYLMRVYSSILTHPDIMALGEGVGQLLVNQAKSVVLIHRAVEHVQKKLEESQKSLKFQIQESHPILSCIEPWMRDKLRKAELDFITEYQWSAHEESLALCRENGLSQAIYFLNRDLAFMKEREPVLLDELKKVKNPTRTFQWRTQIWMPKNWVVQRIFQGESEVIPTVLSEVTTTITNPRSDPNQPVFLVEKQKVHTSTTRWPFWRWINYCYRTWSWTWNAMFFFGIIVTWCSPVSFKALLSIEPFMPDLELSQVNGTMFPRKTSVTPTLCSRLLSLWRHISKSRTEFETRPDTGFIGKGFTRHANRVWNYVLKGFFGTIAIVLVFPVVCVVISGISIAICCTAPLWMPAVTLLFHLFIVLIYDIDNPDLEKNKFFIILEAVIWDLLIQGCLQPILASLVAFIGCPIIAVCILIVGITRKALRNIWDTLMFHAVIKKRGRIPASDSFVARRIAGPGLTSNYYYQISPEQALAAFEAKLEMDELTAYQHEMERLIQKPQQEFSDFVQKCLSPFSTQLVKEGVYKQLEKEAQDLKASLREKVDKQIRDLQTGLSVGIRSKIKLSTRELKVTLKQGAIMLEKFYPEHVMKRLTIDKEEFWENKGLMTGDWAGLAGLIFSEVFSQDFLTPLEETDTRFHLEVHHLNLGRYIDMIRTAEYRDDLDIVSTVHTPKGNIHVHSPYLDVSTFNPLAKASVTARKTERKGHTWRPWKRKIKSYNAEKLLIPLPIPHPTQIAIIIYNRENEDPIVLESEICQNVLKSVEDSVHLITDYATVDLNSSHDSLGSLTRTNASQNSTVSREVSLGNEEHGRNQSIKDSGSFVVNLASSEDITMEPDSGQVTYSHNTFSTTV